MFLGGLLSNVEHRLLVWRRFAAVSTALLWGVESGGGLRLGWAHCWVLRDRATESFSGLGPREWGCRLGFHRGEPCTGCA